jgi:hypothetical protein
MSPASFSAGVIQSRVFVELGGLELSVHGFE